MARKTAPALLHSPQRRSHDHRDARQLIAITPGDPDGIGPEIVAKTLLSEQLPGIVPLVIGAEAPLAHWGARYRKVTDLAAASAQAKILSRGEFLLLPAPESAPRGKLLPGFQAGWSIEVATRTVLAGHAAALVTGPIHKERFQKGGYRYDGHTEFLAHLCAPRGKRGSPRSKKSAGAIPEVTMMLANEQLRVSLVTTHCALKDVPRKLTRAKLKRAILQTAHGLRTLWKISCPRIAVAALNPHAGEGGIFGKEEIRILTPEIQALQKFARATGAFELEGPLPADTLFAKHAQAIARSPKGRGLYDAVVCMYHDQGLIPVKLVDFPHTINLTLGLPIIRTSVDHGVAFDIAGKGVADPSSFQSALALAIRFL